MILNKSKAIHYPGIHCRSRYGKIANLLLYPFPDPAQRRISNTQEGSDMIGGNKIGTGFNEALGMRLIRQ